LGVGGAKRTHGYDRKAVGSSLRSTLTLKPEMDIKLKCYLSTEKGSF